MQDLRNGKNPVPPDILIEVYLDDIDDHAVFKGTNNSSHEDCPGVRVRIILDKDFSEEYQGYVQDASQYPPSITTWNGWASPATLSGTPKACRTRP